MGVIIRLSYMLLWWKKSLLKNGSCYDSCMLHTLIVNLTHIENGSRSCAWKVRDSWSTSKHTHTDGSALNKRSSDYAVLCSIYTTATERTSCSLAAYFILTTDPYI